MYGVRRVAIDFSPPSWGRSIVFVDKCARLPRLFAFPLSLLLLLLLLLRRRRRRRLGIKQASTQLLKPLGYACCRYRVKVPLNGNVEYRCDRRRTPGLS